MIAVPAQTPSYAQGLARHRGDAACPGLWDGLVGLWAPCLGPTGLTLRNFSPVGQILEGTLTNMAPGADWAASACGWTLSFPDSTDYVVVPHAAVLIPPQVSVRVLFKTPATFGTTNVVISKGDSAITRVDYDLYYNSGGNLCARFYNGSWRTHWVLSVISPGTWYDVVFSFDGERARIWLNGRLEIDEPETSTRPQTSGNLYLGNYSLNQTFSFRGQLALAQVWDRVLVTGEVQQMYADCLAVLRLRRRALGRLPAIGGPYHVTAQDVFHVGATLGDVFRAGTAEGEVFNTGSVIGECHGCSG